MVRWPSSLPDYRWPKELLGPRFMPLRLGASLVFHASYLVGLLAWLVARNRPAVMVVRTDGLGDAVVFEPALRAIAAHWKDRETHLWAPASTCELFASAPHLARRVHVLRGYKDGCLAYFSSFAWRARTGWALGRTRFDVALYPALSPEPMGNWLIASVRAAERIAVGGDLENQFDWQRDQAIAAADRVLAAPGATGPASHDLHRNAALAVQLGCDAPALHPHIDLDAHATAQAEAQLKLWQATAAASGARGIVGIVPGGSMGKFRYPPERWAEILQQVWARHRLLPVILAPSSDAMASSVGSPTGVPLSALAAGVNVAALAAIISRLRAVLTIDTGPAHIAAAVRTPTVVLSNGGHPHRFFPWPDAPWVRSLVFKMPCEGCFCRCPLAEVECLTRISTADVLAALEDVLNTPCAAIRAA